MAELEQFSFSKMNLGEQCLASFNAKYGFQKMPFVSSFALESGKGVHACISKAVEYMHDSQQVTLEEGMVSTIVEEVLSTDQDIKSTQIYNDVWWTFRRWAHDYQHNFERFLGVESFLSRELTGFQAEVLAYVDHLAAEDDDKGEIVVAEDWKGLALDTPIPTPGGWSTMGELAVGDEVFDRNGQPCRVTVKSGVHLKPCYRVRFDDGTSIVCDFDHRWLVEHGYGGRGEEAVLEARQIAALLGTKKRYVVRVRNARALDMPNVDLPIEPYTLGVWLGDGFRKVGAICGGEDDLSEIVGEIERRGHAVMQAQPSSGTVAPARTIVGLTRALSKAGLLRNKHIPAAYLRASREQRLALLQGLMDTDGTWNTTRDEAVFFSVQEHLALGVRELALSLGCRAHTSKVRGVGFGREVYSYRTMFAPLGFNPFRLPRKAALVLPVPATRSYRRTIRKIEPIASVPTQCISVDSEDRTYLCGEHFVPTHNTGWKAELSASHTFQGEITTWLLQPMFPAGTRLGYRVNFVRKGIRSDIFELDERAVGRIEAHMRSCISRIREARQRRRYPARPGSWCRYCPIAARCRERNVLVQNEVIVESPEAATRALSDLIIIRAAENQREGQLKEYIGIEGPVKFNGQVVGFFEGNANPKIDDAKALLLHIGYHAAVNEGHISPKVTLEQALAEEPLRVLMLAMGVDVAVREKLITVNGRTTSTKKVQSDPRIARLWKPGVPRSKFNIVEEGSVQLEADTEPEEAET